jgi:hypothetical protein
MLSYLSPEARAKKDHRLRAIRTMADQALENMSRRFDCTAHHHHAFIANWALNRNMHVFCEKPLGVSVEEPRTVRANYIKRKARLATQHGTQPRAFIAWDVSGVCRGRSGTIAPIARELECPV